MKSKATIVRRPLVTFKFFKRVERARYIFEYVDDIWCIVERIFELFGIREKDASFYLYIRSVSFDFIQSGNYIRDLARSEFRSKICKNTTWHRLNGFLLLWLHNTRINELHFLRGHVMPDCKGSFSRLHVRRFPVFHLFISRCFNWPRHREMDAKS